MKITRIKKLVFSPTGGTQKVMDIISNVWNIHEDTIDLSDANIDFSDYCFSGRDLCLIAVPSFGGRVPAIVVERLQQIQSMKSPTILIATYGNRTYEDTLLELKNIAEGQGFLCVGAISAVCQHSIMPTFGIGRPDKLDELQLTDYAQSIYDILTRVSGMIDVQVPGQYPYVEYAGVPLKPKASRKCQECGLCAQKCPVQAIPQDHLKKTNTDECISCMRCVSICPHQARSCQQLMLGIATKKMAKACSGTKPNELFMGE